MSSLSIELSNNCRLIGNNYLIDNNKMVYYRDSKQNGWQFLSSYVAVVKRFKSADMHETMTIEYYEISNGDKYQFQLESLKYQDIDRLLDVGINFSIGNRKKLLDYLIIQRASVPITWVTSGVGFHKLGNRLAFVSDTAKTSNNETIGISQSAYNLQPHGSSQLWVSMFQKNVAGNTALELAVVIGMSATLVPIIKMKYPDIATLLVHFVGQSTSGKTTAQSLAVSVAGPPKSNGGLLKTWATTTNAALIALDENVGVPVAFDELSMYKGKDLTEVVYQLTDGNEKSRATRDAKLKPTKHWETTIVSSGETTLSDKIANNDGLRIRLLELANVQFTNNAKQAEAIKEEITDNYGWMTPLFANKLMNLDNNIIWDTYDLAKAEVIKLLPNNRYRERLGGRIGVITATAKLMNRLLNFNLDSSKILELILSHSNDNWSRDVGDEAYKDFIQYIISKQQQFPPESSTFANTNVMGTLSVIDDVYIRIDILKFKFVEVLDHIGYQDVSTVIKLWGERNLFDSHERDRKSNRRNISGKRETYYSIKVSIDHITSFHLLNHLFEEALEGKQGNYASVINKMDCKFADNIIKWDSKFANEYKSENDRKGCFKWKKLTKLRWKSSQLPWWI